MTISLSLASQCQEALGRAVKACGDNQSELARRCGVKQPHVWKWLKAGRVPTERVHSVVRATDGLVQAHELRPDLPEIFPVPENLDAAKAA
ncbi:transcriptional regulator [Pseudomonas caspiana]|uniref:transcriptional regulator n=1 Tax=Pseudomonas caspiana TaxID=1451454 RepID=UPI000B3885E1|nr:YdaS family helix-turn-helix protein [Pseudomonas caspiana]